MSDDTKKQIIVILGPTACGKTALSIAIAQRFNCEIISADSMQVYQGMNIGSAKIKAEEQNGIPHHLIDIIPPQQPFSVADFYSLADLAIEDITARGKMPLVCGGTGLYINSLVTPYNFASSTDADPQIRERLRKEFTENGGEEMYQRLQQIDPQYANKIHHHDSRRLIRALEIYEASGQRPSDLQAANQPVKYRPVMIGLTADRARIYQLIEQRIDLMLDAGLIDEVKRLLDAGISRDAVSMQGLGYKQIAAYLAGEMDLVEAVATLKRDTRRFAKRQITWFKRDPRICWFDIDQYLEEGELVNAVSFRIAQMLEEA
ncbi:MAG: tRNA (adenosine(37)-N6)-dimethylallyltransferase MiaA [Firmicutes bacterium]|nr:tRNA (adenosine(37)-N6)-dimethylallyltransferase MiaA [Bacillota bacterium]